MFLIVLGARCSFAVEHPLMVQLVIKLISHGGVIGLSFLSH